jgi:hypothetical protein
MTANLRHPNPVHPRVSSPNPEYILMEYGIGEVADIRSRECKFIYINVLTPLLKMKLPSKIENCHQIPKKIEGISDCSNELSGSINPGKLSSGYTIGGLLSSAQFHRVSQLSGSFI